MKVLFFAPHSAIWVHAFPEALVAEALNKGGHRVVYVTCGRILGTHCVAMTANGLTVDSPAEAKRKVCIGCEANKRLLKQQFGFDGYDLATRLTDEERVTATQTAAQLSKSSFVDYQSDGVPIGRIALYEFLLDRKKSTLDLDASEWRQYLIYFENALLALMGGRRILEAERPERVVVYNALYSVNRVICELAELRGIPTYFLHAGLNLSNRLQTLLIGRRNGFEYYRQLIQAWPRYRDQPCDPSMMRKIADHFTILFHGRSVFGYSAAAECRAQSIRQRYGVGPDRKILVATMSSYDERFAAETAGVVGPPKDLLFARQVDWINAVKDYVSNRHELFLIVRVHPREFPNRREQVKSEHARLLEEALTDLPDNVVVNWPGDNISLYDLANEASVFLNAWSAVGKEMSILGVPVVIFAPTLVAYPADLNYCATTREDYFGQIERALTDGWNPERSRRSFRWLALEYGHCLVDIGDAYRQSEQPASSFTQKLLRRLRIAVAPMYMAHRDCARRPEHLLAAREINAIFENLYPTPLSLDRSIASVSVDDETSAMRVELGRLARMISSGTGEDVGQGVKNRLIAFAESGVAP